jgi:hypothetical protein
MAESKNLKNVCPEVTSLNVSNLDVEELEKRLEMTTAGLDGDCWMMDCGTFDPPKPQ